MGGRAGSAEDAANARSVRISGCVLLPIGEHKWLLQSYHLHRGPGIQRIDHNNVFTPEVGAMTKWYMDHLGFPLV